MAVIGAPDEHSARLRDTEAGQAKLLAAAYAELAQARRTYGVESAYWYDWVSREVSP